MNELEENIRNRLNRKTAKAMRRIPSDKERQRKVKRGSGGFDNSYITKENLKHLEKTHNFCHWCKLKNMKADASEVHNKGYINMVCTTPDCPNNPDTKKVDLPTTMKNKYARFVDGELCMDFAKLMMGRDISKLWANKKNMIG